MNKNNKANKKISISDRPEVKEALDYVSSKASRISIPFFIPLGLFVMLTSLILFGNEVVSFYAMTAAYACMAVAGVAMSARTYFSEKLQQEREIDEDDSQNN
jgi:uncharacterized membrane protein